MKNKTHGEVYKEWGDSREKKVTYKNKVMYVRVLPHPKEKNGRAFYIGTYYPYKVNGKLSSTIESIHYDKVVSRFQRFVDEYCTEWQARADIPYKGYTIKIDQEKDKDFYIGYVQFHKNSTFKHLADTLEEVERYCKSRIDRVIYEKEKVTKELLDSYKDYRLEITYEPTVKYPYMGKEPYVGRVSGLRLSWRGKTPEEVKKQFRDYFNEKGRGRVVKEEIKQINIMTSKQEKILELEQLLARISAQLEELKKEKDSWIYKGIVLEYGTDEELDEGYFVGRIKNAPEGTEEFYGKIEDVIKSDLENYIDKLEKSHYIYNMIRPEIKNRY